GLGGAGRRRRADVGQLDRRLLDDGSLRMSLADKPLKSELARARGLGSAKEGVQHWWMQRLTALALIPLGLWLVASLVCNAGADHAAIVRWLGSPVTLGALGLTLLAAFYHAVLGLQVVIEDYIHAKA